MCNMWDIWEKPDDIVKRPTEPTRKNRWTKWEVVAVFGDDVEVILNRLHFEETADDLIEVHKIDLEIRDEIGN